MTWLYLLSGSFAVYIVEAAGPDDSIGMTAFLALLVCLIPCVVDGLWKAFQLRHKDTGHDAQAH